MTRKILNRALWYATAWAITYTCLIGMAILTFDRGVWDTFPFEVLYTLTFPMQGMLNLIIYMIPRIESAREPIAGVTKRVVWLS